MPKFIKKVYTVDGNLNKNLFLAWGWKSCNDWDFYAKIWTFLEVQKSHVFFATFMWPNLCSRDFSKYAIPEDWLFRRVRGRHSHSGLRHLLRPGKRGHTGKPAHRTDGRGEKNRRVRKFFFRPLARLFWRAFFCDMAILANFSLLTTKDVHISIEFFNGFLAKSCTNPVFFFHWQVSHHNEE